MNLLAPQPMTAEQIADLVARTRQAELEVEIRWHKSIAVRIKSRRRLARVAAHYARFASVSLSAAARILGSSLPSVSAAWRHIYPDTSPPRKRR